MWHLIEWGVGGLLVVLYARGRFNTPTRYTASTTVFRFRMAAFFYYASALLAYSLLAGLLENSVNILELLGFGGEGLPDEMANMSGPILAALLMTTLMPHFPLLKKIDEWLLDAFRDMGNIPWEVRVWRSKLAKAYPQVPEEGQARLKAWVSNNPRLSGISENDLRFEDDGSPQYIYTVKVLYLFYHIINFKSDRRYVRTLSIFQDEYNNIGEKFDAVAVNAVRCFSIVRDAQAASPGDINLNAIDECSRSFMERCHELSAKMCELIVYGVLSCEQTQRARNRKLEQFGYPHVEHQAGRLSPNQVVLVSFMVFIIFLAGFSLLGSGMPFEKGLLIATMVPVIFGVAVFCAIVPKTAWSFADIRTTSIRPALGYLASGLIAMFGAALVALTFKAIFFLDFWKALMDFEWSYPWFFVSFALAITIACLADDQVNRPVEAKWLRWGEGVITAAVMIAAGLLVRRWLSEIPNIPADRVPEWWLIALILGSAGFVVGATIPYFYRSSLQSSNGETETGQSPSISFEPDDKVVSH